MFKFLLLSLLFTTFSLAKGTPRLDDVENKLSESEKSIMKQELNTQNLQTKIDELKAELQKLKDTQDNYRIEKSSYDSKMQNNTDLITSQDKLLNYFVVFFTLVLGLSGVFTYYKSRDDVKKEAKEYIKNWIENEATPHFNEKVDGLLKTKVEPMLSSMNASLKDIEAQRDKAKEHIDMLDKVQEEAKSKLEGISKEDLKKIEEKEVTSLTAKDYYTLGWDAIREGKFNTALNEFERSLELVDDDSIGLDSRYFGKGYVLGELKEYKKAIEAYNKSIEINPQKDEAYNNMGLTYYSLDKLDEAIDSYKKALTINPNYSGAYTNFFELQLTQSQPFDTTLEAKYIELFSNNKESFIHYEMLKLLEQIANGGQVDVEAWREKYADIGLGGWSFDELHEWVDGVEDIEVKEKLREAIEVFEENNKSSK